MLSPHTQNKEIPGQEIWFYQSSTTSATFWRFLIEIPLGQNEMGVTYKVNGGQELQFFVPGLQQTMRWSAYSVCISDGCLKKAIKLGFISAMGSARA